MIPKIDLLKWDDMGLDFEQMAKLAELFEKARGSNMRVNVFMASVYDIVEYYSKTAQIFDVSPTTVSRRVKDRAGVADRVLRGTINPAAIERFMQWFGIKERTVEGIVSFCKNSPARYSNRDGLRELLEAFYIGDNKQEIIIAEVLDNLR